MFSRTGFIAALLGAALLASPAMADATRDNPMIEGETWPELRDDVFGEAEIADGAALFSIDAPYRAHDAAVVPIKLTQAEGSEARIVKLTLIVDENPAPVVAEFEFGPGMDRLELETRIRIDLYSNVRAIAETEDGALHMVGRFVKASGGCSAPALKDMDAVMASMGKMKVRFFAPESDASSLPQSGQRREAQVMVRHPNYSGMQMNQVTQLFIPAHFVDTVEVLQGDELIFRATAGISISQDPSYRFTYVRNGAETLTVRATDTDGNEFEKSVPISDGDT